MILLNMNHLLPRARTDDENNIFSCVASPMLGVIEAFHGNKLLGVCVR